jgi:hypothetical protein
VKDKEITVAVFSVPEIDQAFDKHARAMAVLSL